MYVSDIIFANRMQKFRWKLRQNPEKLRQHREKERERIKKRRQMKKLYMNKI